jgi:methyl-accepting chemotaxis protein
MNDYFIVELPPEVSIPLPDKEVAERLAVYDVGHTLGADLGFLWEKAGDIILATTRECWQGLADLPYRADFVALQRDQEEVLTRVAAHTRAKFTTPIDAAWVHHLSLPGREIFATDITVPLVIDGMARNYALMIERLREAHGGDQPLLARLVDTVQRLCAIEIEVVLSQVAVLRGHAAARERCEASERFQETVVAILEGTVADARALQGKTVTTADAARGMLGKTSEVAAAAEQSAVAMREAAHTAAGLIHAIEEVRGEVEVAARVGSRGVDQSREAVEVSEALSEHAKAIESILGLIRDIAGQTNLLALNATIEAARAGDAGRGFAVVAQEVKSLANQTARATDDIASKIAAIQAAARQTVDANGSIRDTVFEIQSVAQRIREAMEVQAHTVTIITAAVDETALAADSMSGTIASIRTDTVAVASDVEHLESRFRAVDAQLAELQGATGDFVERISA